MMTAIPATQLRTVTGGKAKPDAYADAGTPENCAYLDMAIEKRSAATSKAKRSGLEDLIKERIDNRCPLPAVAVSAPK
jgi:hypothetical protein